MIGQQANHPIPGRDAVQETAEAALVARLGPDFVQRLPEAEATVAGGELRVDSQAVLVA